MADQGRMVKTWFAKASRDLRTAKLLLAQNNEDFWESTVFHAQQAAEKSIKGFLTSRKIRFTKTHNIEILVNLVAATDQTLSMELEFAKTLTLYAVAYRYPEENEPPEPLSQAVCEKVTRMAHEGFQNLSNMVSHL